VAGIAVDGELFAVLTESVPLANADDVHALGFDGTGVDIAVIDTGIDTDHPDLVDNLIGEECRLASGGCPTGGTSGSGPGSAEDDNGHGSHVSGIITSGGVVAPLGVARTPASSPTRSSTRQGVVVLEHTQRPRRRHRQPSGRVRGDEPQS
jgi:subtilisin family serine protease